MSQTAEQFRDLMTRVLAGSETAAREVLGRYEPYLLAAIRRRLHRKLRSKFDSIDFAQDVWASFFADPPHEGAFASPDHLAAYLARIAKHKVIDAFRQRLQHQKYNIDRERSLDDSRQGVKDELAAAQPTPSEAVMSEEEWQAFLGKQPLVYRRILILLREGRTADGIAQEMRISSRTVRRVAGLLWESKL